MQDDQADRTLGTAVPPRVLHSDPHDFAGLYIRHRSSFTLHARRYLRDQRDADEVVQEAFLRLFLALPELETELQALAYCRRTITNLCIDRFRAQARRPHLVDLDSVSPDELAEDELDDPVVRAEDAAVVREALSLLSPLHRAALVKREIEEKPLPVIAAELDIPEDSVKHVLFRARRSLRRVLAGTSVAPEVLVKVARKGGGGLAALVMLIAVGLGTGPDLKAIPVFGDDLPDLPGIGDLYNAITGAASPGRGSGAPAQDGPAAGDSGPVGVAASPSPSATTAATSTVTSTVTAATGTVGMLASPSPLATPTVVPATPSASAAPPVVPSAAPTQSASPAPSAEPRPSETATPEPTPTAVDRLSEASSSSPEPKRSAAPAKTDQRDPSAWKTEGIVWINDPDEPGTLIQVPAGQTSLYD